MMDDRIEGVSFHINHRGGVEAVTNASRNKGKKKCLHAILRWRKLINTGPAGRPATPPRASEGGFHWKKIVIERTISK